MVLARQVRELSYFILHHMEDAVGIDCGGGARGLGLLGSAEVGEFGAERGGEGVGGWALIHSLKHFGVDGGGTWGTFVLAGYL